MIISLTKLKIWQTQTLVNTIEMKTIGKVVLGIFSLWDGFTTVVGTDEWLNPDNQLFNVAIALAIMAVMIFSKTIIEQDGILKFLLGLLLIVAVVFDVYTSYAGNLEYFFNGHVRGDEYIGLIAATFVTCMCPILLSVMIHND